MIPFQVDPAWYERHWWREQTPRQRRPMLRARLIGAAERGGRFVLASLQFVGYVLILIVSSDFRVPRCDDASANRQIGTAGGVRQHHEMIRDHHESLRG